MKRKSFQEFAPSKITRVQNREEQIEFNRDSIPEQQLINRTKLESPLKQQNFPRSRVYVRISSEKEISRWKNRPAN